MRIHVKNKKEQDALLLLLEARGYHWYGNGARPTQLGSVLMPAPMTVNVGFTGKYKLAQSEFNYGDILFSSLTFERLDALLQNSTSGGRIEELAKEFCFDDEDMHTMAQQAKNIRRKFSQVQYGKHRAFIHPANALSQKYEAAYSKDGTVEVGCQTFAWEEIEALALKKGWWK